MNVRERLATSAREIRVVIVGMGAMGKGLLYQTRVTPGIRCVAVADVRIDAAVESAASFGIDYRIVASEGELQDAVRSGRLVRRAIRLVREALPARG